MMAFILALLLTFGLRVLPARLLPQLPADGCFHFLIRKAFIQNRMRMPRRIRAFSLDEGWPTYPWLYHWLIAWIPDALLAWSGGLVAGLIDVLNGGLCGLLAYQVCTAAGDPAAAWPSAAVAALLFGTTPALLALGIGPRVYQVTPRPFGELAFTVVMLGGLLLSAGRAGPGLVVLGVGLPMLLLSSKFALQVLVFHSVQFGLASGRGWWFALVPAGILWAAALSGGRYLAVLKGQMVHLKWYWRTLQHEFPGMASRNDWKRLAVSLAALVRSGFRERTKVGAFIGAFENNTWMMLLHRSLLWISALVLTGLGAARVWPHAGFLSAWCWAGLLPFMLTSFRGFRFLGEAERYPEYSVVPAAVLVALFLVHARGPWGTALAALLGASHVLAMAYTWGRLCLTAPVEREVIRDADATSVFLGQLDPDARVLHIPTFHAWHTGWRTELRLVAISDPVVLARDYRRMYQKYPWPSPDFAMWREQYAVRYVVVKNRSEKARLEAYDFMTCKEIFHTEHFSVFEL